MTDTSIAVRYARALYEAAQEQDLLEVVTEEVTTIERILGEIPQIADYCLQQRESRRDELELVEIAFLPGVGELTGSLLKTAVRNGRTYILPHLPAAFHRVESLHDDIVHVTVEVAREPERDLVESVEKKMADRTGRKVNVEWKIVPGLMGGIQIEWDNTRINMSAAHRLTQMKAWMKTDER